MKEKLVHLNAISLLLLLSIPLLSFSRKTREQIWERDGGVCQSCGQTHQFAQLECSHQNHDRKSKAYDDPANGALNCLMCHYLFHLAHKGVANQIGLSEHNNDRAIQGIYDRMDVYDKTRLREMRKPKQKKMFEEVG